VDEPAALPRGGIPRDAPLSGDYARGAQARKREGVVVSLDSAQVGTDPFPVEVLDVHRALDDFTAVAPRQAQLVELRYFGGLSLEEAAEVVGISPRTADKDRALARGWLHRRLGENHRDNHTSAKSAS
jgi:DNA-directed RNA polymerase specialized sigma24 family protein